MVRFEEKQELRIGSVVEVTGTSIRIELDGGINELTKTFQGRMYSIGQIASIIKIHHSTKVLFAHVKLLRMRSDLESDEGHPSRIAEYDQRVMEVDLFGEGLWDSRSNRLHFTRGVSTYPLPMQPVYLTTQDEVVALYQAAESSQQDQGTSMVPIGAYVGAEGAQCSANIDKLFGQHCAIFGSTGSGKSGTVAAVLHGVLSKWRNVDRSTLRPRIIVIDPHGEYPPAFSDRSVTYRAYDTVTGDAECHSLALPYWLMSGEEFRSLVIGKTEEEATSQNNIIYKALAHARLVQMGLIERAKDWVGTDDATATPDAPRPVEGADLAQISSFDRDLPIPFSLEEFIRHIELEQCVTFTRKAWAAKSPSDSKSHRSILDKLNVLRSDPRVQFMMSEYNEGDPELVDILAQFVGCLDADDDERRDVRIIDISGLPNEVAGPLTATMCRLLFQYKVWQTREQRERDPVLVVCEEAHRYVPNKGEAEYAAAQQAVRRIAREGRKYGIGLMLVSQRPADVESTVISQCNSWIIMRLTNSSDQEHVSRYLPDSLSGLTRLLPSLVRREAIFIGEAAALPARIRIMDLTSGQLPNSNDISFADGWSEPPIDRNTIQAVVNRWHRGFAVEIEGQEGAEMPQQAQAS